MRQSQASPGPARGVLKSDLAAGAFEHGRELPAPELRHLIEHFWTVRWDLGDRSVEQETLPHPNVHLIFECRFDGGASALTSSCGEIAGVHTGRFTRSLTGSARVFGVKFRPGGFQPFYGHPVSALRDRVTPSEAAFNSALAPISQALAQRCDMPDLIDCANEILLALKPGTSPKALRAGELVDMVRDQPAILNVGMLADRACATTRSMERLFATYVGVGAKWVIRRYRLQEMVERLNASQALDLAQTAIDLGYVDQAHLINDFRDAVGVTPGQYRARVQKALKQAAPLAEGDL